MSQSSPLSSYSWNWNIGDLYLNVFYKLEGIDADSFEIDP